MMVADSMIWSRTNSLISKNAPQSSCKKYFNSSKYPNDRLHHRLAKYNIIFLNKTFAEEEANKSKANLKVCGLNMEYYQFDIFEY